MYDHFEFRCEIIIQKVCFVFYSPKKSFFQKNNFEIRELSADRRPEEHLARVYPENHGGLVVFSSVSPALPLSGFLFLPFFCRLPWLLLL